MSAFHQWKPREQRTYTFRGDVTREENALRLWGNKPTQFAGQFLPPNSSEIAEEKLEKPIIRMRKFNRLITWLGFIRTGCA